MIAGDWAGQAKSYAVRLTLDAFTRYLRSTSVVARLARAGVAGRFEADLRSALLGCDPGGPYQETISFSCLLAVSPAAPAKGSPTRLRTLRRGPSVGR